MFRAVMAGLGALLLLACQASPQPLPMVLVTPSPDYRDPSKPISVRSGDTFTVALGANPALDFNWQIQSIDASFLSLLGRDHDTVWRESGPRPTGFGGISRLTFEAKAPGQTTLTLILKQGDRPPTETASFSVTITPR